MAKKKNTLVQASDIVKSLLSEAKKANPDRKKLELGLREVKRKLEAMAHFEYGAGG